MGGPTDARRTFRRGDPVLDYWLGRCEGFAVTSERGRKRGLVEEAIPDPAGRTAVLVVRTNFGRRRVVEAGGIEAVTPAGETIALRGRHHPMRPLARRTSALARTAGAATARYAPA